jgi:cation diffusion facilitator family transporter
VSHHAHAHGHDRFHAHSHGLVDPSIVRSRAGLRAVGISLGVLALTATVQTLIYAITSSVSLLADLIHNFGDASTAIPLGVAFLMRSMKAERLAGLAVVLAIFASACVALAQTIMRFVHPQTLTHLWWLAAAGLIGFAGNELAARIRTRAGQRLDSPALVADGDHARADGFVSLAVLLAAGSSALGLELGDPIIGLAITLVILRITWQAWHTIRAHDHS